MDDGDEVRPSRGGGDFFARRQRQRALSEDDRYHEDKKRGDSSEKNQLDASPPAPPPPPPSSSAASSTQQETLRYFHLKPEEPLEELQASVHRNMHVHLPGRDIPAEMHHLPRAKNTPLSLTPQYRAARQRALRAMRADGRVVVAPSVSKADFWNLGRDLTEAVEAGAEWVHFSVMDGRWGL